MKSENEKYLEGLKDKFATKNESELKTKVLQNIKDKSKQVIQK